MATVTCRRCGEVHFTVTTVGAEKEVRDFNKYFSTLTEEQKKLFGGKPSSIEEYRRCRKCGAPYTEMRPYRDGDCPDGVTVLSIMESP